MHLVRWRCPVTLPSNHARLIEQKGRRRHAAVLSFYGGMKCGSPAGSLYNDCIMRAKKTAVTLCAALLLVSLPCFSQSAPGRQQQIESHSRQAGEYLKENQPDLAASEFRAILALDPNNVDAHGNLGAVLFFQGSYANAIPQLRAALKLRPTLWKTQALLGIGEKRTGDIDAARRDLEKVFPKLPEEKIRIETGMELIEIYSETGDLDKSAAIVGVLRKLEPMDEALLYTAYRIYSDLADESLLSLSVVGPNSARMHQAMAHELAKRGDTAEAIKTIAPLSKSIRSFLDSILSLPRCSALCRRQKAEKKLKMSTRQHWKLILPMNRLNADWETSRFDGTS